MIKALICILAVILPSTHSQARLTRVLVQDPTARCLDGSPGAYYYEKGEDSATILLYFEGGGWCGDQDLALTIQNCYQRSKTDYGSSKAYPASVTYTDGILSNNTSNQFRKATRIILRYCDGSGHQGTRSFPIAYKDTQLYFRGNNITIAQLQDIQVKLGIFSKAQTVIVTGGSAGGLAAFLWADYIKDKATTQRVYAVPDSGIFLDSPTFDTGVYSYSNQFLNLFKLSNTQIDPPVAGCVKAYPKQTHKCMMAEYMAKYIETPIFAIQSLYDSWAIPNILNINCINGTTLQFCNDRQKQFIQQYHQNTSQVLEMILNREGNGAWAPACATHGFLHVSRYYNAKYRVPMNSENSIDVTLVNWMTNQNTTHTFIDNQPWPANGPCSGYYPTMELY